MNAASRGRLSGNREGDEVVCVRCKALSFFLGGVVQSQRNGAHRPGAVRAATNVARAGLHAPTPSQALILEPESARGSPVAMAALVGESVRPALGLRVVRHPRTRRVLLCLHGVLQAFRAAQRPRSRMNPGALSRA